MTRELINNNPRVYRTNSVSYLIVTGLGYCCPYAFWKYYSHLPAPLIAARLGVRDDTIRHIRQAWREGDFTCNKLKTCLEKRIKEASVLPAYPLVRASST